ncbi:hypothetical protein ASF06_01760 [Agreia sp. Leaf244]|nr:hypothetical protein ASF06_01760 [Agreia sp. Leaf244]
MAVSATQLTRLPDSVRPLLAWIGLAGIIGSVFLINDSLSFPGPWAAAPVLATALVLAAGTGGKQRYLAPLTNPVSNYIGKISYSLYLWHFPVVILLASIIPEGTLAYYVVAAVLIAGLSVAAFHVVENPVLESRWLRGLTPQQLRDWNRAKKNKRRHRSGSIGGPTLVGLSALTVVTLVLTVIALQPPRLTEVTNTDPGYFGSATPSAPAEPQTAQDILAGQIATAASATEWPTFEPSVDNIADQRVPQWTENGCLNVDDDNADLCVYGSPQPAKIAVVLGDSIATSWLPAIIGALEPLGYQVRALTREGCPVATTPVFPSGESTTVYQKCAEHQEWVGQRVNQLSPDLIVMSDSFLSLNRLASGATGAAAQAEWEAAYTEAVRALPASSAKVSLMAPPGAENIQECYTPLSKPADCIRSIPDSWTTLRTAEQNVATTLGIPFIESQPLFCDGPKCPAFVGKSAVYADSGHMTASYSSSIAPALAEAFAAVGIN